ncbi:hypothetical protein PRIPAC_94724 [Pristionchus pacificus]|uniref:Uncharacterized protein n=1 Tax=Pristionchus pacificus TaxID=54126 RepID=A0A2A6BB86_PRIPA|nr:hypothetical protein PRIPAC_94724 [Pristionchus pacificus]|eukprot:PDM63140.1 hypothetical protein PRIPAC_50355 [Pristionchus pacificus]
MSEFQCESTDSDFGDFRKDGSPTYSGEIPSNSEFVLRDVSTLSCDELSSSNNHFATNYQCNSPNGTSFCTAMKINFLSSMFQSSTVILPSGQNFSSYFNFFNLILSTLQEEVVSSSPSKDLDDFGFTTFSSIVSSPPFSSSPLLPLLFSFVARSLVPTGRMEGRSGGGGGVDWKGPLDAQLRDDKEPSTFIDQFGEDKKRHSAPLPFLSARQNTVPRNALPTYPKFISSSKGQSMHLRQLSRISMILDLRLSTRTSVQQEASNELRSLHLHNDSRRLRQFTARSSQSIEWTMTKRKRGNLWRSSVEGTNSYPSPPILSTLQEEVVSSSPSKDLDDFGFTTFVSPFVFISPDCIVFY